MSHPSIMNVNVTVTEHTDLTWLSFESSDCIVSLVFFLSWFFAVHHIGCMLKLFSVSMLKIICSMSKSFFVLNSWT